MKVKSQKKEKNQALGYILSLAAMAAVVAVFAAACAVLAPGAAASISTFDGSGRSACGKLITLYSFGMSFSFPLYHSVKVFLLL